MVLDAKALREFGERYAQAWCSQQPKRVAAFFAPGGSLKVNNDQPAVGRDAITAIAQGFLSAFPDMKVLMDRIEQKDGYAIFRWTLIGTNTGAGGSGRSVRISGSECWRFGLDGLIAESLGSFDEADYRRQLGT